MEGDWPLSTSMRVRSTFTRLIGFARRRKSAECWRLSESSSGAREIQGTFAHLHTICMFSSSSSLSSLTSPSLSPRLDLDAHLLLYGTVSRGSSIDLWHRLSLRGILPRFLVVDLDLLRLRLARPVRSQPLPSRDSQPGRPRLRACTRKITRIRPLRVAGTVICKSRERH